MPYAYSRPSVDVGLPRWNARFRRYGAVASFGTKRPLRPSCHSGVQSPTALVFSRGAGDSTQAYVICRGGAARAPFRGLADAVAQIPPRRAGGKFRIPERSALDRLLPAAPRAGPD